MDKRTKARIKWLGIALVCSWGVVFITSLFIRDLAKSLVVGLAFGALIGHICATKCLEEIDNDI